MRGVRLLIARKLAPPGVKGEGLGLERGARGDGARGYGVGVGRGGVDDLEQAAEGARSPLTQPGRGRNEILSP